MTPMEQLIAHIRNIAFDMRSAKLQHIVGATIKEQTDQRFQTKIGPDSRPWAAWSRGYAKTRKAGDSLLIDYSTHQGGPHLSDSIEVRATRDAIVVGSAVEYAGSNQETRPFLGLGARDVSEIEARLVAVFEGWV